MRITGMFQSSVKAFTTSFEHILGAHVDIIGLHGVFWQLIFMQDRREESHRSDTIGSEIRDICRYSCAVAEARNRTIRGHLIRCIHHRHQFADRIFDLMFAADARVAKQVPA